jgi:DnaJ like chaperone protein
MNKWLFGGLGWALGGPLGAIMGYAIGSMSTQKNTTTTRGDFSASMLVLFAAVMKADDELKKSELDFIKKFFVDNFGNQHAQQTMHIFKNILNQEINLAEVCSQINSNMDQASKSQLIHILFSLSKADNDIHKSEVDIINRISNLIGLTEKDYKSIKAMFIPNTKADYQMLGITKSVTDQEIKIAYRKMAKQYHPDKVAHLGEDFTSFAENKFKSINDAYQKIKKERNL